MSKITIECCKNKNYIDVIPVFIYLAFTFTGSRFCKNKSCCRVGLRHCDRCGTKTQSQLDVEAVEFVSCLCDDFNNEESSEENKKYHCCRYEDMTMLLSSFLLSAAFYVVSAFDSFSVEASEAGRAAIPNVEAEDLSDAESSPTLSCGIWLAP
jgi:hypothetical protein